MDFSSGIPEYGDRISFEEFADWYTNEGYIIPWIELLDLRKWPYETIVSVGDDLLGMESTDDGTDANDSTTSVEVICNSIYPIRKASIPIRSKFAWGQINFLPTARQLVASFVRLFNDMDFDDIAFAFTGR